MTATTRSESNRWLLAPIAAVVPIFVAAVRTLLNGYIALGDNGLIVVRALDVGTSNTPLLGTWSSASTAAGFDVNHPGALFFDLLAVPIRLLGPRVGLVAGVAMLNAGCLLLGCWAVRRAAGVTAAVWFCAGGAVLAWTMGSSMLIDTWQPNAMVLPMFGFLACVWATTTGVAQAAPWMVAVGSLLVETHLSFAVIVPAAIAIPLASGFVARVIARRRGGVAAAVPQRLLAICAAVFLVAWAQPLIEMITSDGDGNLHRLISSSRVQQPHIGLRQGTELIARVLTTPPWFGRNSYTGSILDQTIIDNQHGRVLRPGVLPGLAYAALSVLVVLVVLGLLWRRARRHEDRAGAAGCLVCGTIIAVAILAMWRTPINVLGVDAHQLRWLWPLTAFTTVVIVVASSAIIPSSPRSFVDAAALGVCVLFAVLTLPSRFTPDGPTVDDAITPSAQRLADQLGTHHDLGTVYFDTSTLQFAEPYSGVVFETLSEMHVHYTVSASGWVRQLGDRRRFDGTATTTMSLLQGQAAADAKGRPDVLVYVDGLSADQTAELSDAEQPLVDYFAGHPVTLNATGEYLTGIGILSLPAEQAAGGNGAQAFVGSGTLSRLMVAKAVVVPEEISASARIYDELFRRFDRGTVALLAAPFSS